MSKIQWTDQQLSAITTDGCNLLVAAAAGSGKTAVLVERIIRKITHPKNPIDIDKLLIVTFTNAAATEMRERIGESIAKALNKNPDSKQLQRQLTLLHKASITTMHSFCLEVIKNNFHYVDVDANFRIADKTELVLLQMESLDELFEKKHEEETNQEFTELLECYSGNIDDTKLKDIVQSLYRFIQSFPWPERWLKEKIEKLNISPDTDFSQTEWGQILLKYIKIELTGCLHMLKTAINIIENTEGIEPYFEGFQNDIINIETLLKECDTTWDEICNLFQQTEFIRLKNAKKGADKENQERVKKIRDEVKKKMEKIKKEIFMSISREIITTLNDVYPLIDYLSKLVMEFETIYSEKKKKKLLLDFNDMEHLCLNILTEDEGEIPSKVALKYQEKFEEIFIDEYQDSNMVQEVIMNTVARKVNGKASNIFMVGDIKQSIYRFRQARPELFLEKYNRYSQQEESLERKIQLYKNFRSREEILNGINYIFEHIMCEDIGELNYTEEEALNFGAKYHELENKDNDIAGGPIELILVDTKKDNNLNQLQDEDNIVEDVNETLDEDNILMGQSEQPIDNIQLEAKIVSNRIKELMKADNEKIFKVYDKKMKKYREIQYRDIIILMRTTKNRIDIFADQLFSDGIPVYADAETGYFNTIEIQTMLALLQIIDNPMQDIPLLSVLRSPIANFTPEQLIDIRLIDKESSLYQALQKIAKDEKKEMQNKAQSFLKQLDKWREKALYMSTDEIIWYLYDDTGYFSFAGAMTGGIQRQANLRLLFERARQYEKTTYKGLFNFINFINKLKSSSADLGDAKILSENENVVRIMSIHKSKGLEFPVVFVSGMGKKFNMQDNKNSILLHQDLGFGPDFVDYKKRVSYATIAKEALKYKNKIETLSEEMRILYVAFTRAKEKLIITGAVDDIEKAAIKWCSSLTSNNTKIHEYEILTALTYLDWIMPTIARHKEGKVLRDIADGEYINSSNDNLQWDIKLFNRADILENNIEQKKEKLLNDVREIDSREIYSKYNDDIIKRLNWNYKYIAASSIPTKMSVTELKRHFSKDFSDEHSTHMFIPPLIKKPTFLEESKGLSAAEKGTLMHFAMQHLDLDSNLDTDSIKKQILKMIEDEFITKQQADSIDIQKIQRFFESSLGKRLLRAYEIKGSNGVYREIPFNIELKCTEIYDKLQKDIYENETVLLQGVIDCYFEEDEQLVLVDYKTDYVPNGDINIIKERYSIQIDYYSKALESITKMPVKEKHIYLFYNE